MRIELNSGCSGEIISSMFLQIPKGIVDSTKLITVKETYSIVRGLEKLIVRGEAGIVLNSSYLIIYLKEIDTKEQYSEIEVEFEQITPLGDTIASDLETIKEYGEEVEKAILKFLDFFTLKFSQAEEK